MTAIPVSNPCASHASATLERREMEYVYPDGDGLVFLDVASDALVIDAYLAKGTAAGLARAETVGNGLRYVQVHDPRHDGRIRAGYAPVPLTSPGSPCFCWAISSRLTASAKRR